MILIYQNKTSRRESTRAGAGAVEDYQSLVGTTHFDGDELLYVMKTVNVGKSRMGPVILVSRLRL